MYSFTIPLFTHSFNSYLLTTLSGPDACQTVAPEDKILSNIIDKKTQTAF